MEKALQTGVPEGKKQLDIKDIETRKEVIIPIEWEGLKKGWKKLFYDAPLKAYKWTARKLDDVSLKMMTGHMAVLSMPMGIMGRNGARVAHDLSKGKYAHTAEAVGVVGAGTAWWLLGKFAYAKILTSLAWSATAGKIGTAIVAAVASAPVLTPAFTAATLLTATAIGGAASTVSLLPAIVNFPVGLRRTLDRFKGIKYDDKQLEEELAQNSLTNRHEQKMFKEVTDSLRHLPWEAQKRIYISLQNEFSNSVAAEKGKAVSNDQENVQPSKRSGSSQHLRS